MKDSKKQPMRKTGSFFSTFYGLLISKPFETPKHP
jgi:hypothetical protein